MHKDKFTEEDRNKVIDFLNFIAKKAEFNNWKTEDSITHFKLLAYIQQIVIPKIESNILEVKEVVQNKEKEES